MLWSNGAFPVWQARSAAGHLYLRYLSLICMGRRVWATLAWLASAPLLAAAAASGDNDTPENPVKAYFHDQRCVGDGCAPVIVIGRRCGCPHPVHWRVFGRVVVCPVQALPPEGVSWRPVRLQFNAPRTSCLSRL